MILPNTDISIMMVRNCLGYPSTDLGTLCTCDKVNMWSKYKPVKLLADTTKDNPMWWKGSDGWAGITVPSVTNLLTDSDFNVNYSRAKPTGGSVSPFRLGDFRGYNSHAVPFIRSSMTSDTLTVNPNDFNQNRTVFQVNVAFSQTNNLGIEDVKDMADYYYCVVIINSRGYIYAKTDTNNILYYKTHSGNPYVLVDWSESPFSAQQGTYTVKQCICDTKIDTWGSVPGYVQLRTIHNDSPLFTNVKPVVLTPAATLRSELLQIGNDLSTMYTIQNYDAHSGSQVWTIYDSGNVYFKFTIKAGDSAATFESNRFSMVVTSAHGTTEDLSTCATSALYDANKNYLGNVSMTLQANESRTFYISYYYPFAYRNGVYDETFEREVVKTSTLLLQYLYSGNQRLYLGGLSIKIIG